MSLKAQEEVQLLAADIRSLPAWKNLKESVIDLQQVQVKDGSVPDSANHARANADIDTIISSIQQIQPHLPHDHEYLDLVVQDFQKWQSAGLGEPDFLDSLVAFHPEQWRVNGLPHLVVFPMYTQNGSTNRYVEAVLIEVIWPEFIADLEARHYSNRLFVPIAFADFTPGYDTNSAVLFPESVAVRSTPSFTWAASSPTVKLPASAVSSAPLPTSPPWTCRPTPRNCWKTSTSRRRPLSCGT